MVAAAKLPPNATPGHNTVDLVRAFAATQPSTKALVDMATGRARTFGELAHDLDDTAAALRAAGVKPGDRIALFVATGIELTTLMFASLQVGAVPVLIDPGMGARNVLNCIREQRPTALAGIAKAHVLRILAFDAFKSVKAKILVGGTWFPGAVALTDTARLPRADKSVHPAQPDDVAAILYTSGSTGPPKGVIYTHAMFAGQAVAIRDMFDIKPGEVDVACFLPFAFFSVGMGMTAVFPDMDFRAPAQADPRKILAALESQRATSAFASPALWEPFSRFLDRESVTLKGVKRVLTAGAPVGPSLHERLIAHLPDGDVFTPYGATEALPVSFMSGREVIKETAALTRIGKGTCVGTLAPDVEVRIVPVSDEPILSMSDLRALPAGAIGEICVRGPCVTRAYDKNEEANRRAKVVDNEDRVWHRMGDLGYLDEQGRLWFCGRKSHRVETELEMLTSIPIEAQAETLWPERAALVGVGPRGRQSAVVMLERAAPGAAPAAFDANELLSSLRRLPGCAGVAAVLVHDGPFPVDRRHNAKIEREKLALIAARKLPHLAKAAPHPSAES